MRRLVVALMLLALVPATDLGRSRGLRPALGAFGSPATFFRRGKVDFGVDGWKVLCQEQLIRLIM